MPWWKSYPRSPREVGLSAAKNFLQILGLVVVSYQIASGQWSMVGFLVLGAVGVSILYAVVMEGLRDPPIDKAGRQEQAKKEERLALEKLLNAKIREGEPLRRRLRAGGIDDEADRKVDGWVDETHKLILDSLGESWAGIFLVEPSTGGRRFPGKLGIVDDRMRNLYELMKDKPNWAIRDEYIESLKSGRLPGPATKRESSK